MNILLSKIQIIPKPFIQFMEIVKKDNIQYCNAYRKIPESENSVDLIYTCHMLEHLDPKESEKFLKECKRVLKKDGILRIVVPSFEILIKNYQQNKNVDIFIEESCLVGEKPKTFIKKLQYLIQGHGWHHQMFTENSLKKKLEIAGFRNITNFTEGNSNIPYKNNINYADFASKSICCECTNDS